MFTSVGKKYLDTVVVISSGFFMAYVLWYEIPPSSLSQNATIFLTPRCLRMYFLYI